jgi:methenyltetrahydromethanopterin cyclohydrolase
MNLNGRSLWLVEAMLAQASVRRVELHPVEKGGRFVDCGIEVHGGLRAGLDLARICLADLAEVTIVSGVVGERACPVVQVSTDHPIAACLASQYAGWQLQDGKFFAMGSGPMRAAAGSEAIFATIGYKEETHSVVGVLETRKPPTPGIIAKIASACRVPPASVTLLAAPTASLAGGVQVVARSVETALHKLHELHFDLSRVVSAFGSAPLPPVAKDDLAAIGRTNDAILYGARVVLFVEGDDESLAEIGPRVPSAASRDYGEPFASIFARYGNDFYAVDPHLFSPAEVVFQNIQTGHVQAFGAINDPILAQSFYTEASTGRD